MKMNKKGSRVLSCITQPQASGYFIPNPNMNDLSHLP